MRFEPPDRDEYARQFAYYYDEETEETETEPDFHYEDSERN